MGAYAAWLSGSRDAAPVTIDTGRTVLVSDHDLPGESLVQRFGTPPRVIVLPTEPEVPVPGIAYFRYRASTNPIIWDDGVDEVIRSGADTVVFLIPPDEVRGRTLLRLRGLGVRRVLVAGRDGRLRVHSPWLLALRRKLEGLYAQAARRFAAQAPDAMTEEQCRAFLDRVPPALPAPSGGRLRIAHHVTSLNSGGAERQACYAAIGQQRAGLDVRLLTRFAATGDEGHYRFLLEPHGVRTRAIGSRWHPAFAEAWRERGLDADLPRLLPPELRRVVADLVGELLTDAVDVLHCYVDDCNVAGLIAAALAGVPAVVLSFRNANPSNFPGLFRPWMRPWYRAALGRPGLVLSSNSEFGARDYERWLGLAEGSVPVVRNAFEPPPACLRSPAFPSAAPSGRGARSEALEWRRSLGLAPDTPVVAGIFRLQEEKRPLWFLECVERLRQRVPGLRVVMAGVGELEPAVRARLAERGLEDTVLMLGQRRDTPTILGGSDVLLLTSTFEGTPNVLLEAQHCGCVPVVTEAGGSREALRHGETGIVVGHDDMEGAVAAVADLLADPTRRLRMAAAGPAFVAEHYSPRALLEGNLRLYRLALAARAGVGDSCAGVKPC
jgi:glycosyltransferase involved in cell wall biosynthesis